MLIALLAIIAQPPLIELSESPPKGVAPVHAAFSQISNDLPTVLAMDTQARREDAHSVMLSNVNKKLRLSTVEFNFPVVDLVSLNRDLLFRVTFNSPQESGVFSSSRQSSIVFDSHAYLEWPKAKALAVKGGDIMRLSGKAEILTSRKSTDYVVPVAIKVYENGVTYMLHMEVRDMRHIPKK